MGTPDDDDPHTWLGIVPGTSLADIRRAYRRTVQRCHPDRNQFNPDAHRIFLKIQWAYRTLIDINAANSASPQSSEPPRANPTVAYPVANSGPKEGATTVVVEIPLDLVMMPSSHIISAKIAIACPVCRGQPQHHCARCSGTGQVLVVRHWRILVPASTTHDSWLVGRELGHRGHRFSRPGDVMVQVKWRQSGIWKWEDGRLVGRLRLSQLRLKHGGSWPVRLPDGSWVWCNIPAGTKPSQWFCLATIQWANATCDAWLVVGKRWALFSPDTRLFS